MTKTNAGSGFFTGFELELASALDFITIDGNNLEAWEVYGWLDFVHTVIDAADPADGNRTHVKGTPPPSGQIGIKWRDLVHGRSGFEIFMPFVGAVRPEDYNAAERRNTQRIPPDGLPSTAIFGVRGFHRINEVLTASLSIENIHNRDWRIMDSGLNEPGTNVIFTLQAKF